MDDELAILAAAAANSLVTAMATDGWQAARDAAARLFRRRSNARPVLATQLDDHADLVAISEPAEADAVRGDLTRVWSRQLVRLLADDATIADDMRALVAQINAATPASHHASIQTNTASDHGQVYAVMDGHQHIYYDGQAADDGRP